MSRFGIILLAAGASSRMGSAKQLVEIDGESLVRRVCLQLLTLQPHVFCVVIGAEAERVRASLHDLNVMAVENERWSQGIGTSIACGVRHLRDGSPNGLLIALCDQPGIPSSHYAKLLERFQSTDSGIAATEYGGSMGVPAVFAPSLFDELAALQGDRGAKPILLDPARRVVRVRCETAGIDLDTVADVERYRSLK